MKEIQRFALEHIYCPPSQDRQYRFSLVRVTKKGYPAKKTTAIYNKYITLPDATNKYHLYVAGNVPLSLLNLLRKDKNWMRDTWYNVQDDMNRRNLIVQLYDTDGVSLPRANVYYSCTHNDGLIIAIRLDSTLDRLFDIEKTCYVRFYSNEYFSTPAFNDGSGKVGIYCESAIVQTNQDKVRLQNKIQTLEARGGKTLVYVNGYYSPTLSLHIPDNSLVEILYDNSLYQVEHFEIGQLRTFLSVKDQKLKYLLFRPKTLPSIQYEDDLEIYVTGQTGYLTKGLYYYQHKDYALTNVTDKDFALYTSFVNTQAQRLADLIGGGASTKTITMVSRLSGTNRPLVYSSLKLHELYKLPDGLEYEVMSNTAYTLPELRAEHLENSDYFKVASARCVREVTKELSTSAVGYNGISYYYARTPIKLGSIKTVDVPELYQKASIAYEYDNTGKLLSYSDSVGPSYIASTQTGFVEFLQGQSNQYPSVLHQLNEFIPLRDAEFRVLVAQYEGITRISTWQDITETELCEYSEGGVTVKDTGLKRVRIFYFDRPLVKDLELGFVDGVLVFPITVWEDRGNGYQNHLLDLPYDSLEVFLNGNRLVQGVGYLLDFPYISICDKKHLDYTLDKQRIHLRLSGYNPDKDKINAREIRGFIWHGALSRNNYYDLREDRVFSTFVDGRIKDNRQLKYAEDDAVVRIDDSTNGLPYAMIDRIVSIVDVAGVDTLPYFNANQTLNTKISQLYNQVFPEPKLGTFNVIGQRYYLCSTVVSKVIHDLLDGNIPASVYTTPYNDTTINELLTTRYRRELLLDPIKANLPEDAVEIHPHIGNSTVSVNIHQYRFLTNLIRIITQNKPHRINLSGYVTINTETVEVATPTGPGGIVVL